MSFVTFSVSFLHVDWLCPSVARRVSTLEQNLDLQQDALKGAGCEKIFVDRISGGKAQRPGLAEVEKSLRPGDTLVVWRLDRLGRSLRDLLDWTKRLE